MSSKGHYPNTLYDTQATAQNPPSFCAHAGNGRSSDPMDFGINHDDGHFLCTLPVAAPEIFQFDGRSYIAALLPTLKGIRFARLDWILPE
jgi:hypothetical protein